MGDTRLIKLFFGIYLLVFAAVLLVLAFRLYHKYLVQQRRCVARTAGRVVRYTRTVRGGENSSVCLPIVSYEVGGRTYRVVGPEYRWYKTRERSSPAGRNEYRCHEKGQVLYVNRSTGSVIGYSPNPMADLYPVGSTLDVYYDPGNPRLAYVLRYCDKRWAFWLTFLAGCGCLVIDALTVCLL